MNKTVSSAPNHLGMKNKQHQEQTSFLFWDNIGALEGDQAI